MSNENPFAVSPNTVLDAQQRAHDAGDPQTVVAEGCFTVWDARRLRRLSNRHLGWLPYLILWAIFVGLLFLIFHGVGLGLVFFSNSDAVQRWRFYFGVFLLLVLFLAAIGYSQVELGQFFDQRKKKEGYFQPHRWRIGPQTIEIESANGMQLCPWSSIKSSLRDERMIVLFVGQYGHALARSVFSSDEDWARFGALVVERLAQNLAAKSTGKPASTTPSDQCEVAAGHAPEKPIVAEGAFSLREAEEAFSLIRGEKSWHRYAKQRFALIEFTAIPLLILFFSQKFFVFGELFLALALFGPLWDVRRFIRAPRELAKQAHATRSGFCAVRSFRITTHAIEFDMPTGIQKLWWSSCLGYRQTAGMVALRYPDAWQSFARSMFKSDDDWNWFASHVQLAVPPAPNPRLIGLRNPQFDK